MSIPLRVLMVEDNEDDVEMLANALRQGGYDVSPQRVETAAEMLAALRAQEWDLVLSDYTLPRFDAPAALAVLKGSRVDIPFIVVTGTMIEDVAVATMRSGVNDYLTKDKLARLRPAVERELREAQTRRSLREAEQSLLSLAAVVQASGDAIISTTTQDIINTWNPAAERLFGWTAAEAIGRPISLIVPPDRANELKQLMVALRRGEQVKQFETVRFSKSGREIAVSVTLSPIEDLDGKAVGFTEVIRDITERRQAEEELKRQRRILQSTLDSIGDGITVADEMGNVILSNPAVEQILRLRVTHARPDDWWEKYRLYQPDSETIFPKEDLPLTRASIRGEKVDQVEIYASHSQIAEGFWIHVNAQPIYDEQEKLRGGVAIFRDITPQKRIERQLAHDALLLSHVRDAIMVTDIQGIVTYWNEAAQTLFGWTSQEMLGRPLIERFPESVRPAVAQLTQSIAEGADFTGDFEDYHKDGSRVWIEARVTTITDARGRFAGMMGVSRDITARKKAEAERDRLMRQLRLQIERMPLGCMMMDADFAIIDWNASAEQIFGYSKAEMLGMLPPYVKLLPESEWPLAHELVRRLRAGDMTAHSANYNRTKDGRTIICEWHNTPLIDEHGVFQGVVSLAQDVTVRQESEEALRIRDRAIQAVRQGIVITDPRRPDDPIIYCSPGFERLTGYSQTEAVGKNCRFLQGADTEPTAVAQIRDALDKRQPCTVELLNYRKDGTSFWNELSLSPVVNCDGVLTHFVGVQTDVTERRALEEQFRQSQKMEAMGQLAGGIAHDFNNMLAVILGYGDNLYESGNFDQNARAALSEIRVAAQRAAALTRKLLAFSRKEVLAPKVLNLNDVVAEMEKMLRRLIGEDVELRTILAKSLCRVKVDPGQVEQVIMNLAVNARDAMPLGGTLILKTGNVELREGDAEAIPRLPPGRYVFLSVSDTGHGMDANVQSRVFEPFFTTKEPGKGTGLGLAFIYGTVKQSNGHISVKSEPGRGTTFTIYLPSVEDACSNREEYRSPTSATRGAETILLVEDDNNLRKLLCVTLRARGYTILEAHHGAEALAIFQPAADSIQLVVTDVVMPQMSGRILAERLRAIRPGVKVLYISGYTDDAIVRQGIFESEVHFLYKPFLPAELATTVRKLLDPEEKRAN